MADIIDPNVKVPGEQSVARTFESLDLSVGTTLVLERVENKRKYQVQLLGYKKSRSIMISAPKSKGSEVLLDNGETLFIRFLMGKTAGAFESHVIFRCYQPFSYLHLAYPQQIESVDFRNAERVVANLFADVDSDFVLVGDWPKRVAVTNLSETGLRFVSDEFLGLVGHELNFSLALDVKGVSKTLEIAGVVRNIEHLGQDTSSREYQVGIQFLDLNDDQRFIVSSYVLAQRVSHPV